MSFEKQPEAVDLSHHLSELAKARNTSPLKGLQKYLRPGVISLAGGMPNPGYFPFSSITAETLVADSYATSTSSESSSVSWFWKLFGATSSKEKTDSVTIPKYVKNPQSEINLATALQYGTATGLVPLQKFLQEFVTKVHQPAYSNFSVLAQTGNTDAWNRVVLTLFNPGELFLTEEWTYPSALASASPLGVTPVAVEMDKEGMGADSLRKILAEWDESARGKKRPHVMYTVPVGQNPSGSTMGGERKKEIYDVCVEYDIIIVEDDPYFFLQEGQYQPKSVRTAKSTPEDPSHYIASLAPSYLRYDYQGRVIRLDTFSKTIAPGSRLGWFTCNPLFAERLERAGEVSTQAPCGFGQSLVTSLLLNWGFDGYVRWLRGLGAQYTARRDFIIDAITDEFDLSLAVSERGPWRGCDVFTASEKFKATGGMEEKFALTGRKPLFSFVPPTSGMFIWLKVHFENHPSFGPEDHDLETKLWIALAEAGLVISPGWFFAADEEHSPEPNDGHYRIAFSFSEFDELKTAIEIFGRVVRDFFKEA